MAILVAKRFVVYKWALASFMIPKDNMPSCNV